MEEHSRSAALSGCKLPEAGACFVTLTNYTTSMAGAELAREEIKSERLGGKQITYRLAEHGKNFVKGSEQWCDLIYLTLKRPHYSKMIQGRRAHAGRPVGILLQCLR